MRIKTKLSLGLVFLFIVINLIGALGFYSINQLATNSQIVLKDNYESVQYVKNMQQALDGIENNDAAAIAKFESNLSLQEHNITEVGEKQATLELRNEFEELKKSHSTLALAHSIRSTLYTIEDLNMNAIVRKHNDAQHTADKAKMYLGIITTFFFLISFTFIVNFPGYIANPIHELTEGIKQIAKKDYSQRLHFKSTDEFGELAEAFNLMATKLEDYENSNLAKILLEKKRIETIINNMKDPIIGFNEKNNILFANTEAVKILGVPSNELMNKYAPDIALTNDLLRTLIQPETSIKPLKIYADGKESYFTKEIYPIISEEQPIGQVILLKNVTYYQELNLAKTNFIATISHELKTPISSIKMSLQLLEDGRIGTINTEQEKLVQNIKDDAQRLLKITGELLDLTQAETGNIRLQKQEVKPRDIIDYAYNAMKQPAAQKKISIDIDCPADIPNVSCDLDKTAWVMVNFLSNAVKHSPENSSIKVSVKPYNSKVLFAVADAGRGIDPRYLDKIFDKFFQVPTSNQTASGSGLGLAISKEFIIAQGGTIWAESEIGAGSTFYFSI